MNNDVTFEKPNVSIILYIYRFVAFVESLSTRSFNNSPYFSFNSALRKVTRGKGAFPSESSVYKVMYLRIRELTEKWSKPIPNWKIIQPQLVELFGERYSQYIKI